MCESVKLEECVTVKTYFHAGIFICVYDFVYGVRDNDDGTKAMSMSRITIKKPYNLWGNLYIVSELHKSHQLRLAVVEFHGI